MIKINAEDFKKRIKCNEVLNNIINELMENLCVSEEEAIELMLLAYFDRLRSNGVNVQLREVDLNE